jgi:hemoglobin
VKTWRVGALLATLLLVMCAAETRATTTLFAAMGGEGVLRTAMDRFADIVEADDRINFTFAETDIPKFKQLLFEQLCQISGGPCHYTGRDMRTAHAKLMITTAEFNALAEDLYLALGKAGVSYRLQNKLMALLAPMKREIVKAPGSMPTTPPAPSTP